MELLRLADMEVRHGSGQRQPRRVASLMTWVPCFVTYAAVLAEAYPHRMRDLMAYLRMIVREAQRHGGDGWRSYDVLFWKIAAANFAIRWGRHYHRYTPHRFWQRGHQQRLRARTAAKVTTSQKSAHWHLSQRHSPKRWF